MKIQHIPHDKLIRIKYEDDADKIMILSIVNILSEELGIEMEELKQTG